MIRSLEELIERARQLGPAKIAVIEGHDPDVLESLAQAEPLGLAQPTLLGKPAKIEAAARKVGYNLRPESLIPTAGEDASIRQAIDLVREGKADLLMKGKVTTANLIRGVLDKERGLRTGRQLSQVIVFQTPRIPRLMVMTDGAINIAPTLENKADICRNAIEVAHALGIAEPKVVLLAALEFVNPAMPATVDAAALVQMNRRGQITGAYLEGPLGSGCSPQPLCRRPQIHFEPGGRGHGRVHCSGHRGGQYSVPGDYLFCRGAVRRHHRWGACAAGAAFAGGTAGDQDSFHFFGAPRDAPSAPAVLSRFGVQSEGGLPLWSGELARRVLGRVRLARQGRKLA